MTIVLGFLLVAALALCAYVWRKGKDARRAARSGQEYRSAAEARRESLESDLGRLRAQVSRLEKWAVVADADEKARELLASARAVLLQAESDAGVLTSNAERQYAQALESARVEAAATAAEALAKAKQLTSEARAALTTATERSAQIVAEANQKAEEIAGKAFDAVRNADLYEKAARAMKNIIEGYGDEYLMPAESLLDDLAEEFGHKDAGQQLKLAREHTRDLIKSGQASRCEYVETNRREGAERFVLDAFNGKVDSILSRVRHDNVGKLEQEIKDACTVVNYGGKAFREARITDEYLAARLAELKWATIVQELRQQEQEEQRRIREQIREEEKAQREYERAMRDAAKDEEVLRKAMAKAEAKIVAATDEQRTRYEAQLDELKAKLREAEERNQRAISMAQQTRRGHVYIVSNVGSFGDEIYKIGLTRRLEPIERIKELGDASVPFDFDVHAVILSDDAPALETKLHKQFLMNQVNKVNHRKEFFRVSLSEIRREIEALGIEAKWTMLAEAKQFRETIAIERAIESDAAARQAWVQRQLTLDPVSIGEMMGGSGEPIRVRLRQEELPSTEPSMPA